MVKLYPTSIFLIKKRSSENFELILNEPIDDSIVKRDFLKIYHQQVANFNDPDQNMEFIFGEKIIITKLINLSPI